MAVAIPRLCQDNPAGGWGCSASPPAPHLFLPSQGGLLLQACRRTCAVIFTATAKAQKGLWFVSPMSPLTVGLSGMCVRLSLIEFFTLARRRQARNVALPLPRKQLPLIQRKTEHLIHGKEKQLVKRKGLEFGSCWCNRRQWVHTLVSTRTKLAQ